MLSLKLPQLLQVHQVPRVRGYTGQLLPPGDCLGLRFSLSKRGSPSCKLALIPPIPAGDPSCSPRSSSFRIPSPSAPCLGQATPIHLVPFPGLFWNL